MGHLTEHSGPELRFYYISLVYDLRGCYLRVKAQSELAVRQYLEREYLSRQGVWKLPWCSVYAVEPMQGEGYSPVHIIDAVDCGTIYEEGQP